MRSWLLRIWGQFRLMLAVVMVMGLATVGSACAPSSNSDLVAAAPVSASAVDPEVLSEEAWAHFRTGDSTSALQGFERAAEIFAAGGRHAKELEALTAAATVVSEVGAPQRALERYGVILDRAAAAGLAEVVAKTWVLRSRSLTLTGDFVAAHEALDRALEAFLQAGSEDGPARTGVGRAYTLQAEGRNHEAIRVGEQAVAASERLGLTGEAIRAEAVVVYGLQQIGEDDRALELYHRLLDKAWRVNDQRLMQFAYCNLAEIEWRQGRPRPAEDELRAVITGLEAARASSPATGDERAAFLGLQVDAYDRLIRLLADTYRGKEGFAIAERFHALSLLEGLRDSESDGTFEDPADSSAAETPAETNDSGLRSRELRVLADLGAARLAFDEAATEAEKVRRRRALDRLEARLAALSLEQRRGPGRSFTPKPPQPEQVQAALGPSEALVAYWVSDERLLTWVLTPETTRFVEIPLPRQRLAVAVDRYLALLRSPQRAEDAVLKGEEAAHIAAGRELYDWLFAPIRDAVADAEVLIVVPDDLLHRLPFESLIGSCDPPAAELVDSEGTASEGLLAHAAYRACRFLGVDKAMAYNPSAGVFLELRQRSRVAPAKASMLAMAPTFSADRLVVSEPAFVTRGALPRLPLAHAADEVRRVAKLFFASTGDVGEQASEARFKAEASRHPYLHLATHGLVDDTLPMVSGLLLEPGDGEDGLLQAYEVLGLDLQSELVTLSACRSGRGELSRGEGIVGLAQSFLHAGASSVLVSQWDVDDRSTPDFMEAFYRRLTGGASRAEALRAARAELFERNGETRIAFRQRRVAYAHPRFWSAFVLIGAP